LFNAVGVGNNSLVNAMDGNSKFLINGPLNYWGSPSLIVVDLVKDPCGKDL